MSLMSKVRKGDFKVVILLLKIPLIGNNIIEYVVNVLQFCRMVFRRLCKWQILEQKLGQ